MRTVITLDETWVSGEIPVPILIQMFTTEQDLTGWTQDIRVERDDVELTFGGTITWDDINKGIAKITFADGDIEVAAGKEYSQYKIEVWAAGGSQRISSVLIRNGCNLQVGAAPTI